MPRASDPDRMKRRAFPGLHTRGRTAAGRGCPAHRAPRRSSRSFGLPSTGQLARARSAQPNRNLLGEPAAGATLATRCPRPQSDRGTVEPTTADNHGRRCRQDRPVEPNRARCARPTPGPTGQWISPVRVMSRARRPRSVVQTCHTSPRECPVRSGGPHGYGSIHRVTPQAQREAVAPHQTPSRWGASCVTPAHDNWVKRIFTADGHQPALAERHHRASHPRREALPVRDQGRFSNRTVGHSIDSHATANTRRSFRSRTRSELACAKTSPREMRSLATIRAFSAHTFEK